MYLRKCSHTIDSNGNGLRQTLSILVAAKHNDLELELVNTQANSAAEFNSSAEYNRDEDKKTYRQTVKLSEGHLEYNVWKMKKKKKRRVLDGGR
jgi:hypothetical protein